MTQKDFTERTGITPTPEQFDYIHAVYMNTSMDKDQFCEEFKKYGESEILRDVHVRTVNFELQCKQKQEVIENIADYLITKACDYDSSEFYFKAVSLIGQRNVVLRKMELGLPFNNEDNVYIANNLK